MTDLATQIEQAGPEQQREMLEAAWLHIHHSGYPPEGPHDTCPKCDAFAALLAINTDEAFTGAALMLVDLPSMTLSLTIGATALAFVTVMQNDPLIEPPCFEGNAATPALAIAAACVRARDAKEDRT